MILHYAWEKSCYFSLHAGYIASGKCPNMMTFKRDECKKIGLKQWNSYSSFQIGTREKQLRVSFVKVATW